MNVAALERIWDKVQKPARYIGGELGSTMKDKENIQVRFAFCFPDLYEIGMSHLGGKILYSLINSRSEFWCERAYAPDEDMEKLMRKEGVKLYGLESLDPLDEFDVLGFTLQYEMSFTSILNMLDLAGLPVYSKDREKLAPLVIAGGPSACNPEPIAQFVDLFVLGEGEEVTLELLDLYTIAKQENLSKQEFLLKAAQIKGIYVPSFYQVDYNEDETVKSITPTENAPSKVEKRIIEDLDELYYPDEFVVPYIKVVHDRTMVEVLRGCIRGCRFCQAGFIYRPFREKTAEIINQQAKTITENSGYEEISLTSLSTSDHSELPQLIDKLMCWTEDSKVNVSLPSLRIDDFDTSVLEKLGTVRKSGLTFAPEAGTQRMRDVINKNVTEADIMATCKAAFQAGYTSLKLYFMLGLPTETMEDVEGIAVLAQKIVDLFYATENRPKGKGVKISLSTACFVPKPFTPFEFEPQDTSEQFMIKQRYLKSLVDTKKITYKYHDTPTSVLEAVLARGDRRLSKVVYSAWKKGSFLDGWSEHFNKTRWDEAFAEAGIDPEFYANRTRSYDEVSPWSHLDYGVSHAYLVREHKAALGDKSSPNCRQKCLACGISSCSLKEGAGE